MTDVFIIGKGPAGISASLYAVRAGFSVTVAGKGTGALEKAHLIENYYGFPEGITGRQLAEDGIRGAVRLGVKVIEDEVFDISCDMAAKPPVYTITAGHGNYQAHAVILAAGTSRKAPAISGLREHEGTGVSYCAVCDAFFYRNLPVAVIGSGEYAVNEASHLVQTSSEVTILTNGEEMSVPVPDGIRVDTRRIEAVSGDPVVSSVNFADGSSLRADGVFIAIGTASAVDLARKLGVVGQDGRLVLDEGLAAPIPGFYAAGDCNGGILQVAKAVYEGALAATSANKYLRGLKSQS